MKLTVAYTYEGEICKTPSVVIAVGDMLSLREELIAYLAAHCSRSYALDVMEWFDSLLKLVRDPDSVYHGMTLSWEYKRANGIGYDLWALSY